MERVDESYHILAISTDGPISARDADGVPWNLKCSDCHMVFGDVALLTNHKAHFCVGSRLGDPAALRTSKGLRDSGQPEKLDLPEEEATPRYDSSRDPRVQQLAELHGQQMEFYKHQNEELEKQKEEIRRQLEALGKRQPLKDNASEELIRELKEEEERSRKMLEELRRQLLEARRPVNIITGPEAPPPPEPESKSYTYPVIYGSSIVQEILAVKEAYIRNGGSNPGILAQLEELLEEARALEEMLKNMPAKQPKRKEDDSQLILVEEENKRLLEQLIQLQEQKMLNNKQRGAKDNRDDSDLEYEIRRLCRHQSRKLHELQLQIEGMRQEKLMDRLMLELQLRGAPAQPPTAPAPPTKIVLKQRPQPPAQPAPTPQVVQTTDTYDVTLPYEEELLMPRTTLTAVPRSTVTTYPRATTTRKEVETIRLKRT